MKMDEEMQDSDLSDIHYLDQYTFIQPMYFILKEMKQHPDIPLDEEAIPYEVESHHLRHEPAVDAVLQASRNFVTE
ncbi:hypothetical protein ACOMHN_037719 [Nucella lapillus]